MLPDETAETLVEDPGYGLTMKDAKTLVTLDDGDRLDYYLDVVQILRQHMPEDLQSSSKIGKVAANW